MNKEVNVYSFYDECYVYFGDYKKLQQRINKAINYIYINYGLLDKYQIEILEDILKGDSDVD